MHIKAAHGQCFLLVGTSVGMTIQSACVHFLRGQLFHSIKASVECGDATVELCMDAKLVHSWSTVGIFLILYSAGGMRSFGTACMCSLARTFSHTHMCMTHGAYVYIHTCICMCICSNQVFVSCAFFFSVDGCRLAAKLWGADFP